MSVQLFGRVGFLEVGDNERFGLRHPHMGDPAVDAPWDVLSSMGRVHPQGLVLDPHVERSRKTAKKQSG